MKIRDMAGAVGDIDIGSDDVRTFFSVIWHIALWGFSAVVGISIVGMIVLFVLVQFGVITNN